MTTSANAAQTVPQTMTAIAFSQYGDASVLQRMERPVPSLAPDQVLIRVAAAGVNPADWVIRSGQLRRFVRIQFPFVPGLDVAGVVEAAGANVTRFKPGDRVSAMLPNTKNGGYAQFAAVAETSIAPVPAGLALIDAAAMPCAALTALQALRDKVTLKPGARVLIHGAAGGVGSFGVQIARILGASVTGTCSARNIDFVRDLGADDVIDYSREDVTARQGHYDVIFDAVGLVGFGRWRQALKPGGEVVTVNPVRGNPALQVLARLTGSKRLRALFVRPDGQDLAQLNQWAAEGQIRPIIDRQYPLAEAVAATRQSEGKHVRGKLVLIVDPALAIS